MAIVLHSLRGGGTQRVLLTFLRHIDRTRFAPELVAFNTDGPMRAEIAGDIPVHDLHKQRLRNALPALIRCLRQLRPQVIVATMGHVNLALLAFRPWLGGAPRVIIREPNTPSRSLPQLAYGSTLAMGYRLLYAKADRIVCQSHLMERELRDDFAVPSERIAYVPNPIDIEGIRKLAHPPSREGGEGLRFVAAGRLTPQKGFDRAIDMFAYMPDDARLTIFGEGPDSADLRSRAQARGVAPRITFAGFDATPWRSYAGADAFLLPSRWEGMPNAALEALACGTPVIATPEAGGIVEVADSAPPNAVTIAAAGEPYIAAMTKVRPSSVSRLRASLLPAEFELGPAVAAFSRVLLGESL